MPVSWANAGARNRVEMAQARDVRTNRGVRRWRAARRRCGSETRKAYPVIKSLQACFWLDTSLVVLRGFWLARKCTLNRNEIH